MVMVYEGSALKHLARMGADGIEPPAGRGTPETPFGAHPAPGSDQPGSDRGPARAIDRTDASGAGGAPGSGADREVGSGADRESAAGSPDTGPVVTCGFCGRDFAEDRSQATCQACPLSKGCGLMRCPDCGYENAKEPGWLTKIREWIG